MSRALRNKIAELSNRNHVELKSEKIELNVVKDLEKAANIIKRETSEANRVSSNMYNRRNDVESAIGVINDLRSDFKSSNGKIANLGSALSDLEKLSNKLETSAKELGIDPMEVKGVREVLKTQSNGIDTLKELKAEQKRTESTLKKL